MVYDFNSEEHLDLVDLTNQFTDIAANMYRNGVPINHVATALLSAAVTGYEIQNISKDEIPDLLAKHAKLLLFGHVDG